MKMMCVCVCSSKSAVLGAPLHAECEGTESLPRNQTSIQTRERCKCSGGERTPINITKGEGEMDIYSQVKN